MDLGKRRVGLALSDPSGLVASALETLDGRDRDALVGLLRTRVRQLGVEQIVVGLPRRTDGSLGPEALAARDFADRMARDLGVPVHMEDERLTTVQAQRSMIEAGARGRERRAAVERVAAVLILQGFLDRHRPKQEDPWGPPGGVGRPAPESPGREVPAEVVPPWVRRLPGLRRPGLLLPAYGLDASGPRGHPEGASL